MDTLSEHHLNRTPKMVKWQRLCGVRFTPVEKPHTPAVPGRGCAGGVLSSDGAGRVREGHCGGRGGQGKLDEKEKDM